MPIRQNETGLTLDQYNALRSASEHPIKRVVAHKSNLDFQHQDLGTALPDSGMNIDWDSAALSDADLIVHLANGTLYFVRGSNPTATDVPAPYAIPAYTNDAKSPSLIALSGTSFVLFTVDGATIVQRIYSVSGTTLTETSATNSFPTLNANEVISHISAVSVNRIHFAAKHTTRRTYQLCVYDDSTSTTSRSRIHYQYPVNALSAATLNGVDTIVLTSQTPGITSVKTEGTNVTRYIELSGGAISFTYQNGNWSDHFNIDVVDRIGTYRIRRDARLSVFNGLLVLTVFSVSGTRENPFSAYRMYTSKDGQHWSVGQILPLDYLYNQRGLRVLFMGDYIFALDGYRVFRSHSIITLGHSPTAMQTDITDYIAEYSLVQDKAAQSSITLENPDGIFNDHAIINQESTITLVHEAGYRVNNFTEDALVQVAITECDAIEYRTEAGQQVIMLVGRDRMAWMTDEFTSEDAYYWNGQQVGGDRYRNNTETQYGGLSHTAQQTGSWITQDDLLYLRTSNEEGIAFSTFNPYIWNGTYQTTFTLAKLNNSEFAGIIFRAMDKDNLWIARYEQASDTIKLYLRQNQTTTLKASSPALGWSGSLTARHMRVAFYYASIRVYRSDDGVTWTEMIDYLADGQHEPGTSGPLLLDRGYVGLTGKGYSDIGEWSLPDFEFPPFTFDPFDFDFNFDIEPETSLDDETYKAIFTANLDPEFSGEAAVLYSDREAAVTNDVIVLDENGNRTYPNWRETGIRSVFQNTYDVLIDRTCPAALHTGLAIDLFGLGLNYSGGGDTLLLYQFIDAGRAGETQQQIMTIPLNGETPITSAADYVNTTIVFAVVTNYKTHLFYSQDHGSNWSHRAIDHRVKYGDPIDVYYRPTGWNADEPYRISISPGEQYFLFPSLSWDQGGNAWVRDLVWWHIDTETLSDFTWDASPSNKTDYLSHNHAGTDYIAFGANSHYHLPYSNSVFDEDQRAPMAAFLPDSRVIVADVRENEGDYTPYYRVGYAGGSGLDPVYGHCSFSINVDGGIVHFPSSEPAPERLPYSYNDGSTPSNPNDLKNQGQDRNCYARIPLWPSELISTAPTITATMEFSEGNRPRISGTNGQVSAMFSPTQTLVQEASEKWWYNPDTQKYVSTLSTPAVWAYYTVTHRLYTDRGTLERITQYRLDLDEHHPSYQSDDIRRIMYYEDTRNGPLQTFTVTNGLFMDQVAVNMGNLKDDRLNGEYIVYKAEMVYDFSYLHAVTSAEFYQREPLAQDAQAGVRFLDIQIAPTTFLSDARTDIYHVSDWNGAAQWTDQSLAWGGRKYGYARFFWGSPQHGYVALARPIDLGVYDANGYRNENEYGLIFSNNGSVWGKASLPTQWEEYRFARPIYDCVVMGGKSSDNNMVVLYTSEYATNIGSASFADVFGGVAPLQWKGFDATT